MNMVSLALLAYIATSTFYIFYLIKSLQVLFLESFGLFIYFFAIILYHKTLWIAMAHDGSRGLTTAHRGSRRLTGAHDGSQGLTGAHDGSWGLTTAHFYLLYFQFLLMLLYATFLLLHKIQRICLQSLP